MLKNAFPWTFLHLFGFFLQIFFLSYRCLIKCNIISKLQLGYKLLCVWHYNKALMCKILMYQVIYCVFFCLKSSQFGNAMGQASQKPALSIKKSNKKKTTQKTSNFKTTCTELTTIELHRSYQAKWHVPFPDIWL